MISKGGSTVRRLFHRLLPCYRRRRARMLAELRARVAAPTGRPQRIGRRTPNGGAYYRSGERHRGVERQPISPARVRDRRFGEQSRRGCDPGEVRAFLHLVADELAALRAELAATRDENLRIKGALREWQSRFRPGAAA
jgi:DivIVA domain-containing protein